MKLQEIVDDIVLTTGRPDREDTIMRAVRAAITETHSAAQFPRDRVEEVTQLSGITNRIKLTLPPRFKVFDTLGAMDSAGEPISLTTANNQYTRTEPSGIFDTNFDTTVDVYYVAGAALNIRSSVGVEYIYMLYYRFPEVADTELETWIMQSQPSLITDLALSKCYSSFGRDKLASEARARWEFSIVQFVAHNIVEGLN